MSTGIASSRVRIRKGRLPARGCSYRQTSPLATTAYICVISGGDASTYEHPACRARPSAAGSGAQAVALTCRDEVLAAISRLMERTDDEVFTVARVFAEMSGVGSGYKESAVYKTMQRMKTAGDEGCLERVGRQGFRLCPAS